MPCPNNSRRHHRKAAAIHLTIDPTTKAKWRTTHCPNPRNVAAADTFADRLLPLPFGQTSSRVLANIAHSRNVGAWGKLDIWGDYEKTGSDRGTARGMVGPAWLGSHQGKECLRCNE